MPHFFRCIRGGKQVKVTGAHQLTSSPEGAKINGEKLQFYAQVFRREHRIIEEPGSDPLLTIIELICIDPNKKQSLISSCSFDMGYYIATLIDSSSRQMVETLHFSSAISVDVNVMIKTIGDNFLQPYSPPSSTSPTAQSNTADSRRRAIRATTPHATDADEMVAAQELDRLRHQQPPQPSSAMTAGIAGNDPASAVPIMPVTATPPASFEEVPVSRNSSDTSTMQARIRALEEELLSAKRERKDAERKVAAHETHSKKIKETYTQLASWYNTLRQEHMELQKKIPKSETETTKDAPSSSAPDRVNSNATDSSATSATDDEHHESKLAELREQSRAAQQLLEQKESELQNRTNELNDARQKLHSFEVELSEKDQLVREKADQLEDAKSQITATEQTQQQKSAQLEEDMKKLSSQQLSAQSQHYEEQIDAMRKEHARAIEANQLETERQLEESKLTSQQWQQRAKDSEDELSTMKGQLSSVDGKEKDFQQLIDTLRTENQNLSQQLKQREEAEEQARQSEKEKEETLTELAEERQRQITALQEDCTSLREQVDTLKKENDEVASPRQIDVLVEPDSSKVKNVEDGESEKPTTELEATVSDLRSQLRMEVDKRKELTSLLDKSDREHDELRDMVKRLRNERDNAQQDIKTINDKLISFKQSVSSNSSPSSSSGKKGVNESPENLVEARDKAILEVFKVRKDLNKRIRKLKKDNEELTQKLGDGAGSSSSARSIGASGSVEMTEALNKAVAERDAAKSELEEVKTDYETRLADVSQRVSNIEFERDEAISEAEQLKIQYDTENLALSDELSKVKSERDEAREEAQQATKDLKEAHNNMSQENEREKSAQHRLNQLEDEINSHKAQIGTLEESLSEATKQADEQVCVFEQEKDDLLKKIENAQQASENRDQQLKKKNVEINELTEKVQSKASIVEESEQNAKLLSEERDASRNRCEVLEKKVDELKQTLGDAKSKDELLQSTKKECDDHVAEITILKSRMDEIKLSSSETETSLRTDISQLQTELTKASNSSQRFETRADELERKAAEYHAELEIERVKKEKEASERERLQETLEDFRSRNSTLSAKISEELSVRQAAQEEVSSLNMKVSELESFVNDLHEKSNVMKEDTKRIQKERDEAIESLASLKVKLSQVESESRETKRELKCVEEKLASSESSREILQQKAIETGGESQKVVEELNMLRTELEKSRNEQLTTASQLDDEKTKSMAQIEKLESTINELRQENERLLTQAESLDARIQRLEGDVSEKKQRLSMANSQVESIRQREQDLQTELNDKTEQMLSSQRELDRTNENNDSINDKYMALINDHEELKRQLSNRENAISMSYEQQNELENRAHNLNGEVTTLQGRLRALTAEHEERMATERFNVEREIKNSSKLRKDLQQEKELSERQRRELQQLGEKVNNLQQGTNGADPDQTEVLAKLINTQYELAYAQEEVMRLRNRLTKMESKTANASSSSLFDL